MKKFLKYFANLRLAIFLLLFIAFFSGLGSIIEQDKPLEFYQANYNSLMGGKPIWVYFKYLSLDHIYSASWFFLLLLIFGFCLLSCTLLQQFPALKFARRYYFYTYSNQFNKLNYKFSTNFVIKSQLCYRLINDQYAVFQRNSGFYGYKGLIGRLGPVIVHLSIIAILLGSILGASRGFTAQEFVPKSEIFHIQNIVKSGNFSTIPQQTFRINDFWVNYNQTGLIKQFQSDISVLTGTGYEITRKTISVNNPLIFKGLTLYQTDWGITGLRIKFSNKRSIIQLPVSRISDSGLKFWISWIPINLNDKSGILILLNNARGKVEFYNEKGQLIEKKSIGQAITFNNLLSIKLIELISSTGIQIKSDPGITIIYMGFGFLILSSFVSYISFSEVWLLEKNHKVLFGGNTNRDKVKFQIEMSKIEKSFSNKEN
jgi:cytochrome c biogenesis protein